MNIVKVNEAQAKETAHGVDVRPLIDFEHAQVTHLRFMPGQKLKPHITPVDAVFYVLEGRATVSIGGESCVVGPDCAVLSPKGIVHFISNETDGALRVLVIKAPRQTSQTKVL